LPAQLKLVIYLFFVTGLFLLKNPLFFVLAIGIICVLLITMRAGFGRRGFIPMLMLLLFTFLGNLLFRHGRVIFSPGPLLITVEGLTDAWVKTMGIFCMIAGARLLTALSSIEELIRAFSWLLRPLQHIGVPVDDFVSTMGLTMQSLPALREQFMAMYGEKMRTERKAGFWNAARVVPSLIAPLFARCLRSPDEFFADLRRIKTGKS
jgi:energy-coupling factor transport system permease protein